MTRENGIKKYKDKEKECFAIQWTLNNLCDIDKFFYCFIAAHTTYRILENELYLVTMGCQDYKIRKGDYIVSSNRGLSVISKKGFEDRFTEINE